MRIAPIQHLHRDAALLGGTGMVVCAGVFGNVLPMAVLMRVDLLARSPSGSSVSSTAPGRCGARALAWRPATAAASRLRRHERRQRRARAQHAPAWRRWSHAGMALAAGALVLCWCSCWPGASARPGRLPLPAQRSRERTSHAHRVLLSSSPPPSPRSAACRLGIYMGMHEDFTLAPVHAHINLLGWVTLALYGLYHRGVERAAQPAGLDAGRLRRRRGAADDRRPRRLSR